MRLLASVSAVLLTASSLSAQGTSVPPAGPEVVDRVVAVVGDTVLLLSDVQAELQQLQAAGRELPADPLAREELAEQILESRIKDLILLEAARDAGITVSPEEIEQMVEEDLREVRRRFNDSEIALQQALARSGLTMEQYRQQLRAQYHDQQLIRSFVGRRMQNRARPLVSEDQIREAFEAQRGNLGTRPATMSLRQVVVTPQPSDSARAAARREAEQVLQELAQGAEFEVLARRFSDDPGTREHGGDLGWFKAGRMVPEFERVAFALFPGQTSGIVETDFGYHIIRVEKVRGPERQARHILIRPELTEADLARARQSADSVAAAIRDGANVMTLARQYDTPRSEIEIERIPVDRLPPGYADSLRNATAGEVVGPIEIEGPGGPSWAVVRVASRQEAGPYTLDDVREQLRTRLQEQQMIEQLVEDLRDEVYVSIAR